MCKGPEEASTHASMLGLELMLHYDVEISGQSLREYCLLLFSLLTVFHYSFKKHFPPGYSIPTTVLSTGVQNQ